MHTFSVFFFFFSLNLFCYVFVLFWFVFFSFNFQADTSLFFFHLIAENLILRIFPHNYDNYSMSRDVPECSGMFHVPGFIDAHF